ncbi:hypothetical protein [Aeromicrobium sp. UC242_57]|uniref:hypothetical protein n=1 Tax=Aeromicrobium sp. UC242_57 TaxID=3374624 RepID=UPI00379FAEBC
MRSPRFIAALAALSLALVVPGMSTAANADLSTVEGIGKVLDDHSYGGVSSTVRAYKADPRTSTVAPEAVEVTADGQFEFPALAAGATWLKVTPAGTDTIEKVVGPFQVKDSAYYFGDVVLQARVGTLSGDVVDSQQACL